jgi:mRNA interferase MazF
VVVRGEVWLIEMDELNPTVGSEIQKTRPCVVISPPELHDHLRTVIVAPMTTKSRPAPYRVSVVFSQKKGVVLLDQIRTIDKTRLLKKLGAVPASTLSVTLRTLQEVFAV